MLSSTLRNLSALLAHLLPPVRCLLMCPRTWRIQRRGVDSQGATSAHLAANLDGLTGAAKIMREALPPLLRTQKLWPASRRLIVRRISYAHLQAVRHDRLSPAV